MFVNSVELNNFLSYESATVNFGGGLNVVYGENAGGILSQFPNGLPAVYTQ